MWPRRVVYAKVVSILFEFDSEGSELVSVGVHEGHHDIVGSVARIPPHPKIASLDEYLHESFPGSVDVITICSEAIDF